MNNVAVFTPRHSPVLRMTDREELSVEIAYRGQLIEVCLLPDEDGTKPSDDNDFSSTQDQVKAWKRGEWWFFNLLIRALDPESREPLEADGFDFGRGYGRLPSRLNHTNLIQRLCDEVCDTIEEAKASTGKTLGLERVELFYQGMADAEWLGYAAFKAGIPSDGVPALLRSFTELAGAWVSGWNTASQMQRIEACAHCQSGSGNACTDHG